MNKQILLLGLILLSFSATHSQSRSVEPDEVIFNKYKIKLFRTHAGGYLYQVLGSNNQLLILRSSNPFTGAAEGFNNREDAVRTAKWEAVHINRVTGQSMIRGRRLPATVATQLKIKSN